jgi:hypothetical protein
MQFTSSFYIHFILSFIGFLLIGIHLCRGSWRNVVRSALPLGISFIFLGHIFNAAGPFSIFGGAVVIAMGFASFFMSHRNPNFVFSDERDGHNVFSLLAGVALFALTVQLHNVIFGVPVFQLVK